MIERDELDDGELVQEPEETTAPDDLELADEETRLYEKLKELREKLRACEEGKRQALEDLQRAKADFLNSRRRIEDQAAWDRERTTGEVIADFLPLIDSFEMALRGGGEGDDDSIRKGITAIKSQFLSILKSHNVVEIEALGKPFNPREHEAVGSRKGENSEIHDTVLDVLQKGYKRGDIIIRPSRVITAE